MLENRTLLKKKKKSKIFFYREITSVKLTAFPYSNKFLRILAKCKMKITYWNFAMMKMSLTYNNESKVIKIKAKMGKRILCRKG